MNRLSISLIVFGLMVTLMSSLFSHESSVYAGEGTDFVNEMCPIAKEPIDGKTSVEYRGKKVGFCCPGCDTKFLAWSDERKAAFVAAAEQGKEHKPAESSAKSTGSVDPYPLDVCIVSGQTLGSMGDSVVKSYDGREVRFCCRGCIGKFEADRKGYAAKINEHIVRDQLRYYPSDKCVVSGEPLVEDGKDIANNFVYGNRLVRLCCKMCEREFKAEPQKFIAKLDHATIATQGGEYPIEKCVVRGGKLGSMGKPAEMVVAGRLVRLCCAGCESKVIAQPAKFLGEIDEAWAAKGKYRPKAGPTTKPKGHKGHDHDH